MHTDKLNLVSVIALIRGSIDTRDNIPRGHVIAGVTGGIVLDSENFRADGFRFAVFGDFVVVAVVVKGGVRDVVEH